MTVNKGSSGEDHRVKPRWSVNRKQDVVLRLLRGEPIDEVARDVGVEAHRLAAWRDEFLESGQEGLKGRRSGGGDDRRLRQAERKIGELTMELEIWRAAARKRGVQIPPQKRPR
jgi:transposase-like protein